MKKRIMICMPDTYGMLFFTNDPDKQKETRYSELIEELIHAGYIVADTISFFYGHSTVPRAMNELLYYESIILSNMSKCKAIFFAEGWENDIYCKFAHRAAKEAGLDILYELEERQEDFQCTLEELTKDYSGGKRDA